MANKANSLLLISGTWKKAWVGYCAECGDVFYSFSANGRYCSDRCKRISNKKSIAKKHGTV